MRTHLQCGFQLVCHVAAVVICSAGVWLLLQPPHLAGLAGPPAARHHFSIKVLDSVTNSKDVHAIGKETCA